MGKRLLRAFYKTKYKHIDGLLLCYHHSTALTLKTWCCVLGTVTTICVSLMKFFVLLYPWETLLLYMMHRKGEKIVTK